MGSLTKLKKTNRLNNLEKNPYALNSSGLEFISIGVGCHCLVAMDSLGLIEILLKEGRLSIEDLTASKNPLVAKSCVQTLLNCEILEILSDEFYLSDLGRNVCENIGLINIFFDGYGKLLAKSANIARGDAASSSSDFNGKSIAEASIKICHRRIDPPLMKTIKNLVNPGETLCDLGCGCASVLKEACRASRCKGIGFEIQKNLLREEENIKVFEGDISCLSGVWPEVTVVMQRHVFHDFVLSEGSDVLRSYRSNFPNLKYFIYVDFVSPSGIGGSILPGFDYIHGLLGITTPTRSQTLDMFERAGFEVVNETSNLGLPNTFLWVLKPMNESN